MVLTNATLCLNLNGISKIRPSLTTIRRSENKKHTFGNNKDLSLYCVDILLWPIMVIGIFQTAAD
jgi:hypothetical protein